MSALVIRLYDTQRSGNAWKIRIMAGLLGQPLERRTLSIDRGDLRTPAFAKLSRFHQVPLLEFPDGSTIPESMAILFFLSAGTPWWPADRLAQAEVMSWLSFEQSRHMPPLAQLRLHLAIHPGWPLAAEQRASWQRQAEEALSILNARLLEGGGEGWVAGAGQPSIADVALYPYSRLARMAGLDLARFEAVSDWIGRFEALPGYQPLFPGRPELNEHAEEI